MRLVAVRALVALVLGTGLGWSAAAAYGDGGAPDHASVAAASGEGRPGKHCVVTTAWGDAWCPGKPLD